MRVTVARRESDTRGVVHELLHSQRVAMLVLVAMLLASVGSSGYLLAVSQPRLAGYIEMSFHVRNLHRSMLDQETGLRGWLASGDRVFLESYDEGAENGLVGARALTRTVATTDSTRLTDPVYTMLLARRDWEQWATQAAGTRYTDDQRAGGELTDFLVEGKRLFDAYGLQEERSTELILGLRDDAVRSQRNSLVAALVGNLVVLVGMGAWVLRRRRVVRTRYVEPFDRLLGSIDALRAGDLTVHPPASGVREIDDIGSQLQELAGGLAVARTEAAAREARLALLAERFRVVVRVGREISGSLNVRYVSSAVTSSAAELLGTPVTLWVRGEDRDFHAASRSEDPHGSEPPAGLVPPPAVGAVAADARSTTVAGARAYPLVLAGMVVGVLETVDGDVDEDTEQVLGALLSTAAAALESAHLHSTAREQADRDGLTGLANRRRFEVDVDEEWQRCRRYGRPMSVIMVDLDHFKRLNDEHGHLLGDEVLRAAAEAMAGTLRSTDTAYRYGGEEFVVLLRETALDDAQAAAERIRLAVAAVSVPATGVLVTASAGVAERHASMAHHTELVAAADAGLYAAKRAGRDRVCPPVALA